MKDKLTVLNLEALQGEKKQGFVSIMDTDTKMPVTIINGQYEGKTILITAGIHGCEYPCIQAVAELAKEIDPKNIYGQIIFVHPVNTQGFISRSAAIVPEDNKNINRVFPGDKDGTITDKIAYVITHEFQDKADFYVDAHGGDLHEELTPYVYYPGVCDEEVCKRSKAVADILNVKYSVKSTATSGAYNSAAIRGIPSILIERGGCGLCKAQDVVEYKKDIMNILKYLNIAEGDVLKKTSIPEEITEVVYLDSKSDGLWISDVVSGQKISKGEKLGEVRDYFGNVIDEYFAEFDGVVLYYTVALSVAENTSLVAYGK